MEKSRKAPQRRWPLSGNLKGKKEPAIQKLDKESTASAKALGLQRLWRLEKAKEATRVGGFHVEWEECKICSWKVRYRLDQTGRLVYVDGDDSYFPAEDTEDSEQLSHLPKVKLARDGAQVGLSVKPC